jgi:hypothetical protein
LKLVTESFSRVDSIKVTKQHPTVHMALWGNDAVAKLSLLSSHQTISN